MIRLATTTSVLVSETFSGSDVSGSAYWDAYFNHNLGVEPDSVDVWILIGGNWQRRYDFVWWLDAGSNPRYYGWDYVTDSDYDTAHIRMYRTGTGGTVYMKVKVIKTF